MRLLHDSKDDSPIHTRQILHDFVIKLNTIRLDTLMAGPNQGLIRTFYPRECDSQEFPVTHENNQGMGV